MRNAVTTFAALLVTFHSTPALAQKSLAIQVTATEDGLTVAHKLTLSSTTPPEGWPMPLLLPVEAAGPSMERKTEANRRGIEIQAIGSVELRFEPEGPRIMPRGGDGESSAQVRYTVPVPADGRTRLVLAPAVDLDNVLFMTQRVEGRGIHLRPLDPYSYREEVEEDGTWQYLSLTDPVKAGGRIECEASHLPAGLSSYRTAALVALVLAALVLVLVLARTAGNAQHAPGKRG